MTQREVELILVRQPASYLTIPIFVVDPAGSLIFFNEPAEALIARRFDETEEMPLEEWTDLPDDAIAAPGVGGPLPPSGPGAAGLPPCRPGTAAWIRHLESGSLLSVTVPANSP